MSFNKLGLSPALLKSIQAKCYSNPSEIQQEAIPEILKGKDILAGAQTGTGKTAAFALPILHRPQNAESKRRRVRVLVLVPPRELTSQVGEGFGDYGSNLSFRPSFLYVGVSLNTLIDKIKKLQYLPDEKQNLLFSATFPNEIKALADSLLNAPKRIQVRSSNSTAEKVVQVVYPVDKSRKRELLAHCIKEEGWFQVLVFSRTKHGANKLAQQLSKEGIDADAFHGNKSQAQRTRALKDFKDSKTQVLVATDIAARGIDINLLPQVVNFDLPYVPEDYIHRIGRTARAGQEGKAISLVSADEHKLLFDIEKLLNSPIPRETIEGFEPTQNLSTEAPKSRGTRRRKPSNRSKGPERSRSSRGRSSFNKKRNKNSTSKSKRRP